MRMEGTPVIICRRSFKVNLGSGGWMGAGAEESPRLTPHPAQPALSAALSRSLQGPGMSVL